MSTLRGSLSVSSSGTATAFTFRDEFGVVTTFAANERLEIHTITGSLQTGAGSLTLFNDVDGDGTVDADETLLVIALSNLTSFYGGYGVAPIITPPGVVLKAISSTSATYDITITGIKRRIQ